MGLHSLVKKMLNRFAFSKKSVTSLLSATSGGINRILLPFTNVFKIFYVLEAVMGSLTLFGRRSWYFNLEELVAFDISSPKAFKNV